MSDISEEKWKSALIRILEELDPPQYRRMLEYLTKIPKSKKTSRTRAKMAQTIIEHYGLEESISAVDVAIDEIPRRDNAVQNLLGPFVQKLKIKQENENTGKRKRDPVEDDDGPEAGKKKCDPVEEQKPAADHQRSSPPEQKKNIRDLNSSGELKDTDGIIGKVVKKSDLRTYKTKEKVEKFFFYLAVADETASIKLMVYGKDRYENIQEDKCYLFRGLIKDDHAVKVTTLSTVSERKSVEVPEEFKMEAQRLIYPESPVCSIKEAKSSADGTKTVQGTVTELDLVKQVKVQREQKTTKRQIFHLSDDTDSTRICIWGENTKQCKDLSVGDVIKVTNLKTNQYYDITSLNSTGSTQIFKNQCRRPESEN